MTNRIFTDEEIRKAKALELVERYRAENERLKEKNERLTEMLQEAEE